VLRRNGQSVTSRNSEFILHPVRPASLQPSQTDRFGSSLWHWRRCAGCVPMGRDRRYLVQDRGKTRQQLRTSTKHLVLPKGNIVQLGDKRARGGEARLPLLHDPYRPRPGNGHRLYGTQVFLPPNNHRAILNRDVGPNGWQSRFQVCLHFDSDQLCGRRIDGYFS
jgi:hypothetical protein